MRKEGRQRFVQIAGRGAGEDPDSFILLLACSPCWPSLYKQLHFLGVTDCSTAANADICQCLQFCFTGFYNEDLKIRERNSEVNDCKGVCVDRLCPLFKEKWANCVSMCFFLYFYRSHDQAW